jgi:hypothetical protein
MCTECFVGKSERKYHMKDFDIDGRVILYFI